MKNKKNPMEKSLARIAEIVHEHLQEFSADERKEKFKSFREHAAHILGRRSKTRPKPRKT
jgi:hypothetical protein